MIKGRVLIGALGGLAMATQVASAQSGTAAARIREVLPSEVAERILATVAAARNRELPADALENRALKFAARGIDPREIERSVAEHAERQRRSRELIEQNRRRAGSDEIEAGAEALRRGVSGADVSALATNAPSGRSLAVPLYVIGSLMDRGLPADEALRRVHERLQARASDAELERMPRELPTVATERRPVDPRGDLGPTRPTDRGTGVTPPARPDRPVTPTRPGGTTDPTRPPGGVTDPGRRGG